MTVGMRCVDRHIASICTVSLIAIQTGTHTTGRPLPVGTEIRAMRFVKNVAVTNATVKVYGGLSGFDSLDLFGSKGSLSHGFRARNLSDEPFVGLWVGAGMAAFVVNELFSQWVIGHRNMRT